MAENNRFNDLLNARYYKPGYTPPPEQICLTASGENIGSLGNFSVLTGLPKAGKSTFVSAMLASTLIYEDVFSLKLKADSARMMIGYFDTESSEFDFYKNISRIKNLSKTQTIGNIQPFSTRPDSAGDIRGMVEEFLNIYPASVVFIDGLLDCVANYNDETESRFVIDWLKRITSVYNCLIVGVVHTGKKDGHTLGHFGSMVDRYAQSVIEITRDREYNIYRFEPKYLRSSGGFADICLQWDGTQYVQIPESLAPKKKPPR